jgi:hypothetical protein
MPANVPDFVQTDDKSFIRDTHSKALLNTDRAALERSRQARAKSRERVSALQALQREVAELKTLVTQLLER